MRTFRSKLPPSKKCYAYDCCGFVWRCAASFHLVDSGLLSVVHFSLSSPSLMSCAPLSDPNQQRLRKRWVVTRLPTFPMITAPSYYRQVIVFIFAGALNIEEGKNPKKIALFWLFWEILCLWQNNYFHFIYSRAFVPISTHFSVHIMWLAEIMCVHERGSHVGIWTPLM